MSNTVSYEKALEIKVTELVAELATVKAELAGSWRRGGLSKPISLKSTAGHLDGSVRKNYFRH